ncbi:uncharacterized protein Ecym_3067 [Eremothecium cymbalariae DBVPG|uniref:Major facilitator superfamily (MFS) profile domain-containing protein n=1 Tax=Eremothecium cymbalariae (strain CBS 270.75 / DBVPG 7215 / KCTC 17166 / NRRL Y-17582) TaxID=931890 RepID=G8JR10_ERECY|nr:Hypothetical protein Ecym_3067 [Eremothecium cymbalariae DBVPG\
MLSCKRQSQLASHDLPQFYLLVVLYFLQGIPVGLAFGTVPFLLKSVAKDTSFTKLGVFSMATYPYSLKILWSPIVDSIFNPKVGRRRSWIIPIQFISGLMLWIVGYLISKGLLFEGVDAAYNVSSPDTLSDINVTSLTVCFFVLVFLCATQDIAVDGWALTILSKQSLSYASTAQTVGLNTGYFLSFSIFLSFNSGHFLNKYIRSTAQDYGLVSFSGYLKLSGWIYMLVTLYVVFYTTEHPVTSGGLPMASLKKDDDDVKEVDMVNSSGRPFTPVEYEDNSPIEKASVISVYKSFIKVLKLPAVQSLIILHFISKFAFQCNEGATSLKLLEKGFKREDLAITVLIDFPFEIIFGYYVAKWSSESNKDEPKTTHPIIRSIVGNAGVLTPWLVGYLGRVIAAILGSYVIAQFPVDGRITKRYFLLVIIQNLLGSFMATVQFVGMSAFHTLVADPLIGGTYMTLLNTLSNLGGTWSRFLVMTMIDHFTTYDCKGIEDNIVTITKQQCLKKGGQPIIIRDGYYVTNFICIFVGLFLFFTYTRRKVQYLQALPISAWRI